MAWSGQLAPYVKPSVPFTGPIYGGLHDGMMVAISGTVLHTCDRFHINFQCGFSQTPRSDIALHFNPRFEDGGYVVCNTFERQSWGTEERKQEMPFLKGHSFEIQVFVKHDSFLVTVNGCHFVEYKHRIPLSRVDTITVSGGVEVAIISFQGVATSAAFPPMYFAPGSTYIPNAAVPPGPYQPQTYPVPYHTSIAGGLYPSRSLIIKGTILPNAQSFQVNLKWGGHIAFHLNPRFSENAIVRNSFLHQSWGTEERSLPHGMPLFCGQSFTIWILCEAHCFKVAVNGQHQFEYKHRVPNLHQIDRLEIEGDVILTHVQV
uniref:Galectin n=1 Tax=Pelusios castaneus TaxID=367368 RepID=A0A8C8RLT7_9SAUR